MEIKARILLVEDDYNFGSVVKKKLEETGYDVTFCSDGEIAWRTFQKSQFDLCLLDIVMPKKNGYELAHQIRLKNDLVPIMFLTSKSQDEDIIRGFKNGADDYLAKPFSMQELMYRMEVWLKRSRKLSADKKAVFKIGKVTFDYPELSITNSKGRTIAVTQKEADLMKFLLENANKTLKREEILYHVWGKDDYFLGRSMDVFITKVRKHIAGIEGAELITLHGIGFKFVVP